MTTLYELIDSADEERIVDFVFDAWLDSDDCGRWTAYDVRDQDEEDDRYDRACSHFAQWFEDYLVEMDDPEERYADERGADFFFAVIDPMKDCFVDAVMLSLDVAEEHYTTLMSLPR